ncbi:MAG: hypothetical protein IE933_01920 [Sphingomonadales bacterium]|nr:hypothetical protein [Sphingomonadales bacterium]MBD3773385.1 hypothetical protein [Paracoccaceae bacterium]
MKAYATLMAALAATACSSGEQEPLSMGVRFGDLQLCKDTVVRIRGGIEHGNGQPKLSIYLSDQAANDLRVMSSANVGKQVALLYQGKVVMNPVIAQPVTQGVIAISGPTKAQLDDIRASIGGPC